MVIQPIRKNHQTRCLIKCDNFKPLNRLKNNCSIKKGCFKAVTNKTINCESRITISRLRFKIWKDKSKVMNFRTETLPKLKSSVCNHKIRNLHFNKSNKSRKRYREFQAKKYRRELFRKSTIKWKKVFP